MSRYVGLHTLPGFSREMLASATPALERMAARTEGAQFVRAYTGFQDGKVVCEFEAPSSDAVKEAYGELGFPYDEIFRVEAICDAGDAGVSTRFS